MHDVSQMHDANQMHDASQMPGRSQMSDASPKADLAVVLLTFNEALHLPRALASVSGFAREIFVIDSYSTDNTVEIALAAGAQVLQHPFQNQARQFQWALDNAPMTSAWVMRLDADEIIEADLARRLLLDCRSSLLKSQESTSIGRPFTRANTSGMAAAIR